MLEEMKLYQFEHNTISAPSEKAAIMIEEELNDEWLKAGDVVELEGDLTISFNLDDGWKLPNTAKILKIQEDSPWVEATDTVENWARFWPNQIVASELDG